MMQPAIPLETARAARAKVLARTVFAHVARGQTGQNLVHAINTGHCKPMQDHDGLYVYSRYGITSAPCRTPSGAIIIWAHTADGGPT